MQYRFAYRRYSLPFRNPVRTAHGLWATRDGILIRVTDAAGRSGYGDVAPIPWFGTEELSEVEDLCRSLGEVIELPISLPGRLVCLRAALHSAESAVGQAARPAKHAYLQVAALLPAGRSALARLEPLAVGGFRTFKWKVGVGDGGDERALLDDLLAEMPTGARLRLDANGAWERREAERWLAFCAERPIDFVEQPVSPEARNAQDTLLGLANEYPTPLALDESVATGEHVARWLALGWPGVFVLKPSLVGNADVALAQLLRAKAPVVFSSALETRIGALHALRLAFAFEGEPRALGFGVYPLFGDGRFDGLTAAPFIRREDLDRLDPEEAWNALG